MGTQSTLGPFQSDMYFAPTSNTTVHITVSSPPSGFVPASGATSYVVTQWAAYPDTIPGTYPAQLSPPDFIPSSQLLGTSAPIPPNPPFGGIGGIIVTPPLNCTTLAIVAVGSFPVANTDKIVVTGQQTLAVYYDNASVPEGSVTYVPIFVNPNGGDTSFGIQYTNNSGSTVSIQVWAVVQPGVLQVANQQNTPLFITGPGGGPTFRTRVRTTAAGSQILIPVVAFETAYLYRVTLVVFTPNGSTSTFFVSLSTVTDANTIAEVPSDMKGVFTWDFSGLPVNIGISPLRVVLDVLTTAFIGECLITWAV